MAIYLSGMFIYPVKSLRGVAVAEARLDRWGVQHDRRYMLVDGAGRFLTQRQYPRMVLIQPQPMPGGWMLNAPGMPCLPLPFAPDEAPARRVKVWDDECDAWVAPEQFGRWFSQFLGVDCQLVYFPDTAQRQVDLKYAAVGVQTSFSDGFPLLLTSRSSLDELNLAMPQPVDMLRFRPNLVITGAQAFTEDSWKQIKVGELTLDVVKPCSRCVIPSLDMETGQKGTQPVLEVLKAKRRGADGKVYFGQNLIHRGEGVLQVGEEIKPSL